MNRGSSAISKLLGNLLDQPTSFAGGRALKPVAAKRKGEVNKSSHSLRSMVRLHYPAVNLNEM